VKDAIEIAVIAAVLYAFYRRFILRPPRLERNREAILVLSLILAIMVTDFAFDGFRFALLSDRVPAIAHERAYAFGGGALAAAFAGLGTASLQTGYVLAYWTQMIVVLSFLVLLPLGEHFHIVTALPALYFRRGRPGNRVPAVDVDKLMEAEDEVDMHAGIRTARDLTWKDGLDAFTCTECGRCKDACPTHLTGKPLSLKAVNDSVKHHLLGHAARIVAGDPKGELPALVGSVIGNETLWACTTCGYCEAACPIELEHLDKFFRLRQHQVMIAGEFPHELKRVFDAYESQGNPWGLPAGERGDWARDLDVTLVRSGADMVGLDYLFYVGSAMSFDPRGQKIARAFVRILKRAGVRFGILGAREGSTGECVRRVGNEVVFRQLATALSGTLGELGVTRIVTCDPHALNSLRHEYPEFGLDCEVVHHTRLIADLLAAGRIEVDASLERVIYHDPCYPRPPQRRIRRAARDPGPPRHRCTARIRAVAREVDVLRRRRRPDVDRRDDRQAHQHRARRAGARRVAADDRDCLSLLRGDGRRRLERAAAGRGHSVARHRRAGRRRDEVDFGARWRGRFRERRRVLTHRRRRGRRQRRGRKALDQVQDRLVWKPGLLRQADLAGAAARIAARAIRRQRRLQVAQRMLVELGPDEPAFTSETAALHLIGGDDPVAAAAGDRHQLVDSCPSCERCRPGARRPARPGA
jgi:Fe-S oxidoreductase